MGATLDLMSAEQVLGMRGLLSSGVDAVSSRASALTPAECVRLAELLERARPALFPGTVGAPEHLIGESDHQDFYFRQLVDLLLREARDHGAVAVRASIDALWCFTDERFAQWSRRGARRLNRETIRQVAGSHWPRAFMRVPVREVRCDTRVQDDDPPAAVIVKCAYTPPTEAIPLTLSMSVHGFVRDDGSMVTIDASAMGGVVDLPAIETFAPPRDASRRAEYAAALLAALARRVPKTHAHVLRTLRALRPTPESRSARKRRRAEPRRVSDEMLERLRPLLTRFRQEQPPSADLLQDLMDVIDDPEIREGHAMVEQMRDVSPQDRRTILATMELMVRGAKRAAQLGARAMAILVVILALLVYVPSPAQAAVKATLARWADKIVRYRFVEDLLSGHFWIDADRGLFVHPDGVATPEHRSDQGSIRLAPGSRTGTLKAEYSLNQDGLVSLSRHIVPLTELSSTGILAVQFREDVDGPIVPWAVEINLIPDQDHALAEEIATREATVTFDYRPPLQQPPVATANGTMLANANAVSVFAESHEFPHIATSYTISATLRRPRRAPQTFTAVLSFQPTGTATFSRPSSPPIRPVTMSVREKEAVATTIFSTQLDFDTLTHYPLMFDFSASAIAGAEQRVTFTIAPPDYASNFTIDFGDSSQAVRGTQIPNQYSNFDNPNFAPPPASSEAGQDVPPQVHQVTHRYRVGDRQYPIRVYSDDGREVWQQNLYVFADRPSASGVAGMYITPQCPGTFWTRYARSTTEERGRENAIARYQLESGKPCDE